MKIDIWSMFIKPLWPLWLAVIVLRLLTEILPDLKKMIQRKRKFGKIQQWNNDNDLLHWLKGMKPWEFEEYISRLYSNLGYKTERVGRGYDGGVDVIIEKDRIKQYIQCKKYITTTVGVKEIREFYGVLVDHASRGKGIFITTNIFSSEAVYFAQGKPIELIDGQGLVRLIRQLNPSTRW